jgi:hypothetical protein
MGLVRLEARSGEGRVVMAILALGFNEVDAKLQAPVPLLPGVPLEYPKATLRLTVYRFELSLLDQGVSPTSVEVRETT